MPLLASIRFSYIPMSPVTAVALLYLGGILLVHLTMPSKGSADMFVIILSVLLFVYGLIEVVEYLGIPVLSLEERLFPDPPMTGAIPSGRMSPVTAMTVLLSGAVVPLLVFRDREGERQRVLGDLAGGLGILVAGVGTVFVLSYLHGAPFLYKTSTIPMAATTALAALLLGTGQILAAGPDSFPLRLITGHSARARLLRGFVSTTVGVVVVVELLRVHLRQTLFGDVAFLPGVSTAAIALIAGALIARVALKIGDDMDRSDEIRKRTEDKLRESEDRYRDLVESSQDLICTHDLEGRILSVNPYASKILGYTRDEILRMNFRDIMAPRVRHSFEGYLDEIRTHGVARGVLMVQTRDGKHRIWEYKNSLRTDGVTGPIVRGMAQDITERKRAESALREGEDKLRLILKSIDAAVYGMDPEGHCTFCNPSMLRLLGYRSPDDLFVKNMHGLIHHTRSDGTPYPVEECRIFEVFRKRESNHVVDEVFWRADGTSFPVEYWSHPQMKGDEVVGVVVTFVDITERKSMENQLRQSQKIEAVGRLAGGIAHDFNNLLTVITGYSELLLNQLGDQSPQYKDVEEIKRAGDRAAELTRQLLAYSRRQVLQPRVLDLNEVVSGMGNMLRRLIGEDVEFRTLQERELWSVKADPGQMEQVLANLVVNARDAMPGGGTLTIETANALLDEGYSRGHFPLSPGSYVMLAVSDTGVGMDEETASKIFEPFFTTKETGKGTGLGLATVYGIVKQSGGFIWVYSEPGKGSIFKIYLPRTEAREEVPHEDVLPVEDLRGQKTILLAEDDEPIRKLAADILERYGYTVLPAGDGEEALRVAEAHEGEIGLLLTDVVMPRMGGTELCQHLRQLRPDVKVLYVSGYTGNAIVHQGVLDRGVAFLQKPYSPASLARKVKEVLKAEG